MQETELKIDTKDVKLGMYVCRIDRPWLESPFLLQGFLISDPTDRELLMTYCKYCYVDISRSKEFIRRSRPQRSVISNHMKTGYEVTSSNITTFKQKRVIKDTTSMEVELKDIRNSHATMTGVIKEMLRSLKSSNKLDLDATREAIKPMVDSMIRNPDALLWLNRLRQLDDYNYSHSLGCSMWAMAMGRQLGLKRLDIESLGIGGLLLDIGKTKIPQKILTKTELLTETEIVLIQKHVQFSLEIIDTDKKVNFKIRAMVENHHERIDGSGYPKGLVKDEIPLFAKIAAIIDCYDAITSKRSYANPLTSQEAVRKLYEWRGKDFQTELVEEFIQAIGMFPTGTLVELTTGEVGVVIAESRTRRLRPKIMLLLNSDKSMRDDYIVCNLMKETHDSDGKPMDIKCALPTGSFGIKADDYFL